MRNIALVLVALVVIGVVVVRQDIRISRVTASVDRLVGKLERMIQEMQMSEPGQMYHEHWSGNPATKHTVTTTFQDAGHENESRSDWNARHEAAVLALKIAHPPL
jgi:hypothetical protein